MIAYRIIEVYLIKSYLGTDIVYRTGKFPR